MTLLVAYGGAVMTDYVDKLLQDANEIRVIRACHTCRHHEGYGLPHDEQWCLAAGTDLDEARAEGKCGLNLDWWQPTTEANSQAQAPQLQSQPPQKLPLLAWLRKRLFG
jgi:hypothetical protein